MTRDEKVLAKMLRLLTLTRGRDMLCSDFTRVRHDGGDLFTEAEIRRVGYKNGRSLWQALLGQLDRRRFVYRDCTDGHTWPSDGHLCWRGDFLREHWSHVPCSDQDRSNEPWDVIDALASIRGDVSFRRAFRALGRVNPNATRVGDQSRLVERALATQAQLMRDPELLQAFMELCADCGVIARVEPNPNGLLGYVWRFDADRLHHLIPLLHRPLEAYAARPRLAVVERIA